LRPLLVLEGYCNEFEEGRQVLAVGGEGGCFREGQGCLLGCAQGSRVEDETKDTIIKTVLGRRRKKRVKEKKKKKKGNGALQQFKKGGNN